MEPTCNTSEDNAFTLLAEPSWLPWSHSLILCLPCDSILCITILLLNSCLILIPILTCPCFGTHLPRGSGIRPQLLSKWQSRHYSCIKYNMFRRSPRLKFIRVHTRCQTLLHRRTEITEKTRRMNLPIS
jgi:hypothetical protein